MSALDNPIWSSLTTTHARFAIAHGEALRFPARVHRSSPSSVA